MSSPRFMADEDLRDEIVSAVRRAEPLLEFVTARELGLAGAADDVVLEFAHQNGQIVVSHDVSTMPSAAGVRLQLGLGCRGLMLVPQSRETRAIADNLILIWSATEADEWDGRIVYLPF